eukprot:scaffold776_cov347-Pavlova_lutheri.AAC.154
MDASVSNERQRKFAGFPLHKLVVQNFFSSISLHTTRKVVLHVGFSFRHKWTHVYLPCGLATAPSQPRNVFQFYCALVTTVQTIAHLHVLRVLSNLPTPRRGRHDMVVWRTRLLLHVDQVCAGG